MKDFKELHNKILNLEAENNKLKRQLQKAAELNHKMWLMLQDQTIHTEQLERMIFNEEIRG